jgi:hypothetical protein
MYPPIQGAISPKVFRPKIGDMGTEIKKFVQKRVGVQNDVLC